METLTENQLDKVAHTLGVNLYHAKLSTRKKDKHLPSKFYRNYYCYSNSKDGIPLEFKDLLDKGFIKTWEQYSNNYFCISDEGIIKFREYFKNNITDTYKAISKSKERYQDYLDADCGQTYEEFLNIKLPIVEYARNGILRRFVSTKYDNVHGLYMPTHKEAKKSYKEALRLYKIMIK